MPWYTCTVNEVGPASDGTETPAPVIYINLSDKAGSFSNTWFYAANGTQQHVLDVGIAAISDNKNVEVAAVAPVAGNQPFTEISRIYGFPQPPQAPSDFHLINQFPLAGGFANLQLGWTENSYNVDYFTIYISGTHSGSTSGQEGVGAEFRTDTLTVVGGDTYSIYIVAVNAVGEARSNTIQVEVPGGTQPSASLRANVAQLPPSLSDGTVNYGLEIQGSNFGASEIVDVTVDWTVAGQGTTGPFKLSPPTTTSAGTFTAWFTGVDPYGICPITVGEGQPQPAQTFEVSAHGRTSNKTASATSPSFTCPPAA